MKFRIQNSEFRKPERDVPLVLTGQGAYRREQDGVGSWKQEAGRMGQGGALLLLTLILVSAAIVLALVCKWAWNVWGGAR